MTRWKALLAQLVQGIWFRTALFTLAGIVLAVLSSALSTMFPESLRVDLGQGSVESILGILASSMLAVTTFSLTAMVYAYSSAMSSGTPRSTQLLINDRTSQNALSTFVGSFAFSIVGIVALSMNIYTDTGRTLLFLGTLVIIIVILATLLRWIAFLTRFGRMADIIDRVEDAAASAMSAYAEDPLLGGARWVEPPIDAWHVRPTAKGSWCVSTWPHSCTSQTGSASASGSAVAQARDVRPKRSLLQYRERRATSSSGGCSKPS